MRKYSYVILWIAFFLTIGIVWFFGNQETPLKEPPVVSEPSQASSTPAPVNTKAEKSSKKELIGLWVPFMSLTTTEKTEAAFQENFKNIAQSAKEKGINTLFVHVRPFGDALYPSALYPWSHILTGTQGQDPGFDPLAFMVGYTHELGMEFHAWLNPLRIKNSQSAFELAENNLYSQLKGDNPYYFMEFDGGIYLNPSHPYIRKVIADGAAEIVEKYEVDGIHFDDYFYPSTDSSLDSQTYESYASSVDSPVPLAEWRTANVNTMIAEVYQKIKSVKPTVVFGISPTGNIPNNEQMNADVKTWCSIPGYIDYICPQIYYSYDHPTLGYRQALEEWINLSKHKLLKTYIGLALYKAGTDADENTWQPSGRIIADQIKDARTAGADGVILYSSDYLNTEETKEEVKNVMALLQTEN